MHGLKQQMRVLRSFCRKGFHDRCASINLMVSVLTRRRDEKKKISVDSNRVRRTENGMKWGNNALWEIAWHGQRHPMGRASREKL
jgi:hypothetical protein